VVFFAIESYLLAFMLSTPKIRIAYIEYSLKTAIAVSSFVVNSFCYIAGIVLSGLLR